MQILLPPLRHGDIGSATAMPDFGIRDPGVVLTGTNT